MTSSYPDCIGDDANAACAWPVRKAIKKMKMWGWVAGAGGAAKGRDHHWQCSQDAAAAAPVEFVAVCTPGRQPPPDVRPGSRMAPAACARKLLEFSGLSVAPASSWGSGISGGGPHGFWDKSLGFGLYAEPLPSGGEVQEAQTVSSGHLHLKVRALDA
ncbi:hypothetical protein K437DRAFT_260865 [Tilletiaria anomala UBC 951]|uniref:Uncharacterized protein n=1 Tax=Tilletiaria anomala (strain ATCC 24038 / CBS 436.72 / UBC 951) TaxID=1037660 RepID=A0A066WQ51_TILAU|nr:uncharacterized protein K437DRAFT_260865 [Tilletiaria anomala UBC 951]KDN53134.1 hypothetical protein K437DRAFT_260865 [Tilletiaria anomala UBC 951]